MTNLKGSEISQSGSGWNTVDLDNVHVMSIGFMLPHEDDAVIWRGPRKHGLIKQFLMDVDWGELEYLIIDTPPGTSDEHISTVQLLKEVTNVNAVVVTTPQEVALSDVRKELNFCKRSDLGVIGVIENMGAYDAKIENCHFVDGMDNDITETIKGLLSSYLNCKVRMNIFPSSASGGAVKMAQDYNINYLGIIPLDTDLLRAGENGEPIINHVESMSVIPICDICKSIFYIYFIYLFIKIEIIDFYSN